MSIGPQSEADAYETLAYREKRRRQSTSERAAAASKLDEGNSYLGMTTSSNRRLAPGLLPTPASSNQDLFRSMTGGETELYVPLTPSSRASSTENSRRPSQERRQDEREDREMFSKLEKPRVRYDVEVITKLIVYSGQSPSSPPSMTCPLTQNL